MKESQIRDPQAEAASEMALYRAILSLRSPEECRQFFRDLCTPAEIQAMADRWRVVELLEEDRSYREIHDRTGVSVTTVGRVARFLEQGNGGYRLAVRRLRESAGE